MKYLKIFLSLALVLGIIFSVSFEPKKATKTEFLLDTYITVTAYGKNAETALEKAMDKVFEIDKMLSVFNSESEISKINKNPYNTPVKVSDECFYLIERAVELSKKTDGDFDITIKPVMDLWGFGNSLQAVPDEEKLASVLSLVNYKNIILDEVNKTVTLKNNKMAIDLGGIAKGYAADCAAKILKSEGIESAYLDFGGNVVTIGEMPQGLINRLKTGNKTRPFVIGIQSPEGERGEIFEKVTASGEKVSVVTSGGYERYFEENGEKYHHIIDPKTGKQPETHILSVTVISDSSEICDALSTAFFVSGPEKASGKKELFKEVIFYMNTGEIIKITGEK